jgi:hypothetical protein
VLELRQRKGDGFCHGAPVDQSVFPGLLEISDTLLGNAVAAQLAATGRGAMVACAQAIASSRAASRTLCPLCCSRRISAPTLNCEDDHDECAQDETIEDHFSLGQS